MVFLLTVNYASLRSQIKQDLDCSSCEIVFGSQLCLPGEFFKFTKLHTNPSLQFVNAKQKFLSKFQYREPRFPTECKTYVDSHLKQCKHVFIRNDAVRSLLQPTYDGPFKVVQRTPKYFKVICNAKDYTVSVDRLKAAFLLTDFLQSGETRMTNNQIISGNDQHVSHPTSRNNKQRPYLLHRTNFTRTRQIKLPLRYQDYDCT